MVRVVSKLGIGGFVCGTVRALSMLEVPWVLLGGFGMQVGWWEGVCVVWLVGCLDGGLDGCLGGCLDGCLDSWFE